MSDSKDQPITLRARAEEDNDFYTLYFTGELIMNTVPEFQQAVTEALYRKKVILVFDEVDFVDSTGFSVILETMRTIQNNRGAMRVVAAAAQIRNLFRALFGEHLPVHTSRADAIESF